ncbi:glycosidase [Chloroflexota bacterium]
MSSQASDLDPEDNNTHKRSKNISLKASDEHFRKALAEPLNQAERIGDASIVVGIPFYNEADTIGSVVEIITQGLREYYPDEKCVIVAAGSLFGGEALKVINSLPQSGDISRIAFILNDEKINGKGWSLRAIAEISRSLGADLAIIEADLKSHHRNGEIEGLSPDWVRLLLEPIKRERMDLVLSRFNRHYLESPISSHVLYPIFTVIYNRRIRDLAGGQWGISHRLIRTYWKDIYKPWSSEISGYGIDSWLATLAIANEARICEANLGVKIHVPTPGKSELVLRMLAGVLFGQIVADREWRKGTQAIGEPPLLEPIATFGIKKTHQPREMQITAQTSISRYRHGFNIFHSLYENVLPREAYRQLEELARTKVTVFDFPTQLWSIIIYRFLLAFAFVKEFAKEDLLNAFIPLYQGYVASFIVKVQNVKSKLAQLPAEEAERLTSLAAEREVEKMVDELLRQRPDFLAAWEMREEAIKPPVPKVTYREFIPGVPLVVPLELTAPDGEILATANGIYDSIFSKHKREFDQFVYGKLGAPRKANSHEIAERIRAFMHQVEEQLDHILLPGDLATVEGTREVVEAIFRHFPRHDTFTLHKEMITWLLRRQPPVNLVTKLNHSYLEEMLKEYEPNDILALAGLSEGPEYIESLWKLLEESARPDHFKYRVIKPLVVSNEEFPSLMAMNESGALSKIAGVKVISNLHKGMGGEFSKLRYFTHVAKNIVEFERFGKVWHRFADEKKDLGEKVINSLRGHWGKDPLSAHNIFENGHQRVLVQRVREMAQQITQDAGGDASRLRMAEVLKDMADSYHLAQIFPDGTLIPCSAWTWASYSYKGGLGVPTPLSLHVERDWTSREFLTDYYKAMGGTEEAIEEKIIELMEEGREWEDLAPTLLGVVEQAAEIVPEQTSTPEYPQAGTLTRFAGNPVLEPIKEHAWESRYVLNPGTLNLKDKIYLIYRAVGDDGISRFGLAVSEDGFKFTERLDKPIFEPKGKSEKNGCEDPRLTLIDNRIHMVYTAFDGLVAQIAVASISVGDFLNYRWGGWQRHGLVFPGFTDKDGTLFPECFNGKFAMLHRVDPHIWITFSRHLRGPWPRGEHQILAGSRSGMVWDGRKIGGGAQPIKTKRGWLLITHGVDHAHVYRLGVMLLDLADPSTLIYRSPNPILEPTEGFELGGIDKYWVPNVVFSCGAVPRTDNKEIFYSGNEILVYYGAADTSIGVALAKINDLIPV